MCVENLTLLPISYPSSKMHVCFEHLSGIPRGHLEHY